jgi:hypothetical protein
MCFSYAHHLLTFCYICCLLSSLFSSLFVGPFEINLYMSWHFINKYPQYLRKLTLIQQYHQKHSCFNFPFSQTYFITLCYILCVIWFILFLAGLGFELKALHLLGRHYTFWAMPPALFALVIFLIERPRSSYLHFPCSWDDRYTPPHPAFHWLIWDLSHFFFPSWP